MWPRGTIVKNCEERRMESSYYFLLATIVLNSEEEPAHFFLFTASMDAYFVHFVP